MAHEHDVTSRNGIRYRRLLCPNCGRPHLAVTLCKGHIHLLLDVDGSELRILTIIPDLELEYDTTIATADGVKLPLIAATHEGLRTSLAGLRQQANASTPAKDQPSMTLH